MKSQAPLLRAGLRRSSSRLSRHRAQEHAFEKRELTPTIEQVDKDEESRDRPDTPEYQSQFETIRSRNLEDDIQMKSRHEEKIEDARSKCKEKLQLHQRSSHRWRRRSSSRRATRPP